MPTTDGRELSLTRYTQPEPELKLLLEKLKLTLPAQPPPKITAAQAARSNARVVQTFEGASYDQSSTCRALPPNPPRSG